MKGKSNLSSAVVGTVLTIASICLLCGCSQRKPQISVVDQTATLLSEATTLPSTDTITQESTATIITDSSKPSHESSSPQSGTPSNSTSPATPTKESANPGSGEPSDTEKPTGSGQSVTFAIGNDSMIMVKGHGFVQVLEAYEKGYIRIKIINGLAYVIKTSNGVDYIQDADPMTGISYDGVSPIIYTYSDGTTGTELKDGAKYEIRPGECETYMLPRDTVGRIVGSICPDCGIEIAVRCQAGYCLQWPIGRYCTCCGELVWPRTCHHCSAPDFVVLYCSDCGRLYGDGTNGTCIGWYVDMNCPQCGELVPSNTCHTCKN